MFILNKNTGVTQECVNDDVIKICKKDMENYAVADTIEELPSKNDSTDMPSASEKEKPLEKMKVDELKALAKEKGIEGADSLTKAELIAVLKDVV